VRAWYVFLLQGQDILSRSRRHNRRFDSARVSIFVLSLVLATSHNIGVLYTYRLEVHSALECPAIRRLALIPVQVAQPVVKPRIIIPDHFKVALEDRDIRDIESEDRGISPDIRLGDVVAKEVRAMARLTKMLLQTIERFEDGVNVLFVRFLRLCETGLVHAVVEVVVDPLVHGFDLLAQVFWEEAFIAFASFAKVLWDEGVELSVEHADDLAGLVAHDGFCNLDKQLYKHQRQLRGLPFFLSQSVGTKYRPSYSGFDFSYNCLKLVKPYSGSFSYPGFPDIPHPFFS
jgi:hypothetical protein